MKDRSQKLFVRKAQLDDVADIQALFVKVYPTSADPYTLAELRGQVNNFPNGVFVAVYEDKIVGYAATLRAMERRIMRRHTWEGITGAGYASTHNPRGDWLYGYEVFVDPDCRRLRIGERLYQARAQLCRHLNLKGIVICGRLPLLRKRIAKLGTAEAYLEAVQDKTIKDPTYSFQIREGFKFVRLVPRYLPEDEDSMGYAALMVWRNPSYVKSESYETTPSEPSTRMPGTVRVAAVQYQQRGISSFEDFERIVSYFVDVVSDYKVDFVLFPELFTLQLLSIENEPVPSELAIDHLTKYTERLRELFQRLAIKFNVNIIAGSHPTKTEEGHIRNICYVCLRDGSTYTQPKIHPTPDEIYWWNVEGGDDLDVIPTDCGPIGVLICYDSEFPELARYLTDQGANILFVPFCTDERNGYLRVRYSCQARAVENQCYVVLAGNVGNLPRVHNMDIQYAQSCILTPCDFHFARDGIAADTTPNAEAVVFADLRMDSLIMARNTGSVRNRSDRRHELYRVVWGRGRRRYALPNQES